MTRPRVGIADAEDPRVLEAAAVLAGLGQVAPVLVGPSTAAPLPGVEHETPAPGTTSVEHLAHMVASGALAAGVGGSLSTSAQTLRAGIRALRPQGRPSGLVSACFALGRDGDWVTYSDCVVSPEPDAHQLATIAADAADHHQRTFGDEPRVAMLSFSTRGSASHPRVALVQEATRLLRQRRPDLPVDGEVQFDVAVDAEVAARKAPASRIAGRANVLVFPSLEAANIAYKVAERVGGLQALGSFVLGLTRPWADLSRGCSVDDITATVTLLGRAVTADEMTPAPAG